MMFNTQRFVKCLEVVFKVTFHLGFFMFPVKSLGFNKNTGDLKDCFLIMEFVGIFRRVHSG